MGDERCTCLSDGQEKQTCSTSSSLRLDWAALHCLAPTSLFATNFRGCAMSDPFIGLFVAIGLAAYLVYALVRPEKF